jgi:hypothetical protein
VAGQLIPVQVHGCELLVESVAVAGMEPTSRLSGAAEHVGDAFARAQQAIVEIASSTVATIQQAALRSAQPDQVEVEFGLKFSAKGDVIVAGATGEATLKVRLSYQPTADQAAAGQVAGGGTVAGQDGTAVS